MGYSYAVPESRAASLRKAMEINSVREPDDGKGGFQATPDQVKSAPSCLNPKSRNSPNPVYDEFQIPELYPDCARKLFDFCQDFGEMCTESPYLEPFENSYFVGRDSLHKHHRLKPNLEFVWSMDMVEHPSCAPHFEDLHELGSCAFEEPQISPGSTNLGAANLFMLRVIDAYVYHKHCKSRYGDSLAARKGISFRW